MGLGAKTFAAATLSTFTLKLLIVGTGTACSASDLCALSVVSAAAASAVSELTETVESETTSWLLSIVAHDGGILGPLLLSISPDTPKSLFILNNPFISRLFKLASPKIKPLQDISPLTTRFLLILTLFKLASPKI